MCEWDFGCDALLHMRCYLWFTVYGTVPSAIRLAALSLGPQQTVERLALGQQRLPKLQSNMHAENADTHAENADTWRETPDTHAENAGILRENY